MKKQRENAVYALHFHGELLESRVWEQYSENYGAVGSGLYGWRPPKKLYYTLGAARNGRRHLPEQIQKDVRIVKYTPAEIIED